MQKIITIGSSLVDIFVQSPDFLLKKMDKGLMLCQRYGDKVEVDSFEVFSGGGASNTAVGFKRMGFDVSVMSETGKDVWAQFVTNDFTKERVNINLMIKEKKEITGGSVILLGKDGGRTVMVHRGASSMLDPFDIPVRPLIEADWVHLTNSDGQMETLSHIFQTVAQNSVGLSWNPGKKDIQLLVKNKLAIPENAVEIFLVNREEWQMLEAKQEELFAKMRIIVITHSRLGGQVFKEQSLVVEYDVDEVTTVDETGAGDAFGVGFISAYLKNKDLEDCCEWGKKNSANVVQHLGAKAGLLRREDF